MKDLQLDYGEVTSPKQLDAIYRLRCEVHTLAGTYLDELADGRWLDEHDGNAIQFAAQHEGVIVGAARLSLHTYFEDGPFGSHFCKRNIPEQPPIAFFSRLVVSEPYRNKGIAGALDQMRLRRAISEGARISVAATSNIMRHSAFVRLGFKMVSTEQECQLKPNIWGTLFALELGDDRKQL